MRQQHWQAHRFQEIDFQEYIGSSAWSSKKAGFSQDAVENASLLCGVGLRPGVHTSRWEVTPEYRLNLPFFHSGG
jgi:hypothetical protein